jgi:predicted ATPase
MDLIKAIRIEGLRSIQDQELTEIGSLNVFVGKNSSGKSNALRALNLFFNGEIESGNPIDFARDHFEQIPRKRKKKRIAVSVKFKVPNNFRFRKGLEPLEALGNEFTILRSWELDQVRRSIERFEVTVEGRSIPNGEELGRQFLTLITYRYIPNRTVPSDILRDESQAIANSIFGRMKGDKHASALLAALTEAAGRMLEDAGNSLAKIGSPLSAPSVSTADSIGEMLTMGGFQANGAHGLPVQDENWGAGHQAFFLYQVLRTLDTTYSRFFGWKQATIWGVEEPEAALHRELETRLADQFRQWCFDEGIKLQIFVTTHSPIFTMAADKGVWVELSKGETIFEFLPIPELTHAADVKGVSGWVHPILYFPWNPVVLTEGQIDADVLSHVAHLAGLDHLRFVSLPNMDVSETRGGKDKVISFLKSALGLVQNRSRQAPLFVLFDWEVTIEDIRKARLAYGKGGEEFVHKMNDTNCDFLMSKDFKGIERFYPPEVLVDAHNAGELVLGISAGKPYSISQTQLSGAKGALRDRIIAINSVGRLKSLLNLVMDVENKIRHDYPVQMKLADF